MSQIGIAIGLPFGGRLVHPMWAMHLKLLEFPVNTSQNVIHCSGKDITTARNEIAKTALELNCKYLFFIDDDVILPRHSVNALGYILDNYKDEGVMVSTGIYCTKTFAPAPVIYRDDNPGAFWDWRINEIFDIDSCGAGCMMINTEVFKSLEFPYFRTTESYKPVDDCPDQTPVIHTVSEDIYFCRTVRNAGFKIKAHGAVICPHFDATTGKFYELPDDSLPVKREAARQAAEKGK